MRHATALAIILVATPATACTDWKAVAAFDAIIAANDRAAVKLERATYNEGGDNSCAAMEARLAGDKPTRKGDDALTFYKECQGAKTAAQDHQHDLERDKNSALADTCQEK